jgi:hypothetical protein
MIILISEIDQDDLYLHLSIINDKTLLDLYRSLIKNEQYEFCQAVLDEINKRGL